MHVKEKHLFRCAFLLGLGAAGAFDGIIFHQLLQWHHMVDHSNQHFEVFMDGILHFLAILFLLWGSVLLFYYARKQQLATKRHLFWGSLIAGFGTFNAIEGIVNHHIFQFHHVKTGSPDEFLYDILFLLINASIIFIGLKLASPSRFKSPTTASH